MSSINHCFKVINQYSNFNKEGFKLDELTEEDSVEGCWKNFWEPLVGYDLEKIKKELYDFRFVMKNASKVYYHITNGATSNVLVYADTIISLSDDSIQETVDQAIEDYIEDLENHNDG